MIFKYIEKLIHQKKYFDLNICNKLFVFLFSVIFVILLKGEKNHLPVLMTVAILIILYNGSVFFFRIINFYKNKEKFIYLSKNRYINEVTFTPFLYSLTYPFFLISFNYYFYVLGFLFYTVMIVINIWYYVLIERIKKDYGSYNSEEIYLVIVLFLSILVNFISFRFGTVGDNYFEKFQPKNIINIWITDASKFDRDKYNGEFLFNYEVFKRTKISAEAEFQVISRLEPKNKVKLHLNLALKTLPFIGWGVNTNDDLQSKIYINNIKIENTQNYILIDTIDQPNIHNYKIENIEKKKVLKGKNGKQYFVILK